MAKRYVRNIMDWRLRQEAPDVAATNEIARLIEFERFMLTTKLRGEAAILAFMTRVPEKPASSPQGSPHCPAIADAVASDNPDIPPVSHECTHSWGNRLGYSY